MTEQDPLARFIAPMLGLPAWNVKQGVGSFLTLEFGEPKLKVQEWQSREEGPQRSAHVHGAWHLWIYCCRWHILRDGGVFVRSQDEDAKIARGAAFLNGQKLNAIDSRKGQSRFAFDRGGVLETWPYGNDPSLEQWTIMTETEAFAYRADDCFSLGSVKARAGQEIWRRLRDPAR
jgi:hypothetical protein